MSSIDDDAKMIGINEETWRRFKEMYVQDDLPGMLKAETEAKQSSIDKETFIRRKQALAQRWFGYYKKCKDQQKKNKLIDQYNFVATMKQRD